MSRDKNELIIHVMHGYDSLQAPTGEDCFGCYIHGEQEIYVADNIPTDQLFHTIAHEYMHYLQDIDGKEFDENEANDFAWSVFTPCYQQGKKDLVKSAIERFEKEKKREKPYSTMNLLWRRAISILEELQQYRAIGTVEEFKALKEKADLYEQAFYLLLKDDCKRLPEGWTGSIDELYVGRKQFYLDKVEKTKVLGKIKT